jgi:hypothetical protein
MHPTRCPGAFVYLGFPLRHPFLTPTLVLLIAAGAPAMAMTPASGLCSPFTRGSRYRPVRDHRQEHPHPGWSGSSGRGDVPRRTRGPGRLRPDHGPGDGWRRTDLCGGHRQPGAARDRSGWPGDHPGGDGGSLGVGSCAHGREGWPGGRCHLRRRHPGAGPGPRHGLSVRFRRPLPPEGRHPGGEPAGRSKPSWATGRPPASSARKGVSTSPWPTNPA